MGLSLRFFEGLEVEYGFRALDNDQGAVVEIESRSGRDGYRVAENGVVRVSFDTGVYVCEWEGTAREDELLLSYRIEEHFGLSSGPKCVGEGEACLLFERESNIDRLAEPGAAPDPAD